jgi:hypothetical protein
MTSLSEPKARFFAVVARRVVPEVATLDAAGLARFESIVDRALLDRPPEVRRQVALFLGVVRWLPALRFLRPLDRLGPGRQERALRWFQECPVGLFRRGFWGLKTLVFMGVYGQVERWGEIGYAPRHDAVEALRARA